MQRVALFLASAVICLLALSTQTNASVPKIINYQGVLTDSAGTGLDTTVNITFGIYDAAVSGGVIWTEVQNITVVEGLFSAKLGENSFNPLGSTIFSSPLRYLGITVGTDPELSPRVQLVSVPYAINSEWAVYADLAAQALNADTADFAEAADFADTAGVATSVIANSIGSAEVIDNSLTASDLGTGSVGTSEVADNSLTASDLASGSVGSSELASGAVFDIDVNAGAAIAVSKISGTAVNLSSSQTISGSKTFNNLNISTTTRYIVVPGTAFSPEKSTDTYTKLTLRFYIHSSTASSNVKFMAPINLPHGATITKFEGYFMDNTANNATFRLRIGNTSGGSSTVANMQTSGASTDVRKFVDNTISSATVDNVNSFYYLQADWTTTASPSAMKLYGVRVWYTIIKPLP